MRVYGALFVFTVGFGFCAMWLRTFWQAPRRVPAAVLAAPILAGALGIGGMREYDVQSGHWVSDISLVLLVTGVAVTGALLVKRLRTPYRNA